MSTCQDQGKYLPLVDRFHLMQTVARGQSYKTFYGRYLRIFLINLSVCTWQAFTAWSMFVGKVGAYPSEAPFSYSTLG
jgi:hypothetical protein